MSYNIHVYKQKYLKYKNKYLQQKGGDPDRIKGEWLSLQLSQPYVFRYRATVQDIVSGNIIAEFILRLEESESESKFTIRKTTSNTQQEQREQDDTASEKELKKEVIMHFINKELSEQSVTPFSSIYPRNQTNIPVINGIINIIAPQIYKDFPDMRSFIRTNYPHLSPS